MLFALLGNYDIPTNRTDQPTDQPINQPTDTRVHWKVSLRKQALRNHLSESRKVNCHFIQQSIFKNYFSIFSIKRGNQEGRQDLDNQYINQVLRCPMEPTDV